MMMDALVKSKAGVGLELMKMPIPTPGPNEVQIKIRKSAICGTDLHIYNWDAWSQKHVKPGTIIGHEYVGEIAQIGENVEGFKVGDLVSGEGHIVCGLCRNCKSGNSHWCKHTKGVGVNRNGAFAEYLVIPASNCIHISEKFDENVVAFFDAYGNATHTALAFELVGEDVLVTGAGPIGIMGAAIAAFAGARNVVLTDVNDYRLDLAKKVAPKVRTVNVAKEDLNEVMKEMDMAEGFDVAMEMSGSANAFTQLIRSMRTGGKVSLLGLFGGRQPQVEMDDIILKGLTLQGIYGRKMFETWYKMGAMVHGGLDLRGLITHKFPYTKFEEAFSIMNTGNSGKIILEWSK